MEGIETNRQKLTRMTKEHIELQHAYALLQQHVGEIQDPQRSQLVSTKIGLMISVYVILAIHTLVRFLLIVICYIVCSIFKELGLSNSRK